MNSPTSCMSQSSLDMLNDISFVLSKVEKIVLENTEDNHYKYYHLSQKSVNDRTFLAQWGRIGSRPQHKEYVVTRDCDMFNQMKAKLKKGYVLKTYKCFGDHSVAYEEFLAKLGEDGTELFD